MDGKGKALKALIRLLCALEERDRWYSHCGESPTGDALDKKVDECKWQARDALDAWRVSG